DQKASCREEEPQKISSRSKAGQAGQARFGQLLNFAQAGLARRPPNFSETGFVPNGRAIGHSALRKGPALAGGVARSPWTMRPERRNASSSPTTRAILATGKYGWPSPSIGGTWPGKYGSM